MASIFSGVKGDEMSAMKTWATEIQEFRELRQMLPAGQVTMAKLIGVHPVTVARWESGTRRIPQMALRLARLLVQTSAVLP